MRLSTTLVLLGLIGTLLLGCGGGGGSAADTGPGVDPMSTAPRPGGATAAVRAEWEASPDCARPPAASRWGCSIAPYRCQAVVVDRGWAVDCAKPGRSISFTVPPRK